jgi:hypothetical protein
MTTGRLLLAVAIASSGLAACGHADRGGVRTVTVAAAGASVEATTTSPPVSRDALVIETRVTDARGHKGEVLATSSIGESAFCPGGKTTGGSEGPTITATFHCADGTLTIEFAPTQPSLVQSAPWDVVAGSGHYEGFRGSGWMAAKFDRDDPDSGREFFVGTLGK